ncbi:TAT-variant-translocated molybdopterin oxidoreductase [Salinisphaera aquimarina]|uniref:TAT-variant-translocated molybdopterin oxidoreductase n=1 Tax=Salinisphaera aquimarina TaxID=2094031 RepID=A0ABV7EM96_9GAMM
MKRLQPTPPDAAMPIDLEALRERLRGQDGPTYWRSLDELANTPAFENFLEKEFPRWAPIWQEAVDRRSVLKLMAASMALAGLTACGAQPPETIEPYVNMPEGMVPGQPRYYATASLVGGYAHGLLVQSREGRPVKIEGNPDHPATRGACDVFSQASVLSVYDPDRSDSVLRGGQISSVGGWLDALAEARAGWDDGGGAGLCLLTETVTSPSRAAQIRAMQQRWPQMRWFVHEPAASDAPIAGAALATGRRLQPRYRFDRARCVLSIDADFLGRMPGFLSYARDFAANRRPTREHPEMSRLYALESTPSITGASADHRRPVAADELLDVTRALASALGLDAGAVDNISIDKAWLQAVADDLRSNGSRALVIAGEHLPTELQALVIAINDTLGALGQTMVFQQPVAASDGAPALAALAEAIRADQVRTLVVMDANPVYSAPADLDFTTLYDRVALRIHYGGHVDETAERSHWHVNATHALESWDDARAFDGTTSIVQPLIEPLHGGHSALEFLIGLADGVSGDARELLQRYWRRARPQDFDAAWRRWLQRGVVPDSAAAEVTAAPRGGWQAALAQVTQKTRRPETLTLQFSADPAVWDGRHANNGWLQELPRPLTKLTWGQAALISPALAERRQLKQGDVVRLTLEGRRLKVPVYVLPGQPDRAITLSLGYGRTAAGRIGNGVGASAYALRASGSPWVRTGVELQATGRQQGLATTQHHHAMEGRDLIRATALADFVEHPDFAKREPPDKSLYPEPWPRGEPAEHQWGMSIDLNACIGCNACTIACQAENNIPVVGQAEVLRGHDMHWIRIDRYFEGQPEAPRMIFQPVPCMHCENAPCEYVCPVEATQHSAEGLNEMIYNRCVGTRYCSQNCPYKVRRFNWFNYTDENAAHPTPAAANNPDVTVRSRGVMEKCTYCVQRINAAKITAARSDAPDNGRIADGAIVTACQQACPTDAIVFGDIADPATAVSKAKASPLDYGLLTDLNTRPRTTYLAAVRNPNPAIAEDEGSDRKVGDAAG